MKIVKVENPVYAKDDDSHVNCQVTFQVETGEEETDKETGQKTAKTVEKVYDYTASQADQTEYGQQLWQELQNGEHGEIAAFVPPDIDYKFLAAVALAGTNDAMLRIVEAVSLKLNSLTSKDVVAFATYRRALRKITETGKGPLPDAPPDPEGI